MSCGEERPGKSMKNWAPIHLNVAFVVGVLFVLLTYLVLSQQAAISSHNGTDYWNHSFRSPRHCSFIHALVSIMTEYRGFVRTCHSIVIILEFVWLFIHGHDGPPVDKAKLSFEPTHAIEESSGELWIRMCSCTLTVRDNVGDEELTSSLCYRFKLGSFHFPSRVFSTWLGWRQRFLLVAWYCMQLPIR